MLLEAAESSYFPAFTNMQQDVLAGNVTIKYTWNVKTEILLSGVSFSYAVLCPWTDCCSHLHSPALEEAKDICTYLRPLERLFEDMESAEFPDVRGHIGPLMHTVCLVWANSRYYNTPARLIVLLQETCNLLIQQVNCTVFSLSSGNSIPRACSLSSIYCGSTLLLSTHYCGVSEPHLTEITSQYKEIGVGWWCCDFVLGFSVEVSLWVELFSLFFILLSCEGFHCSCCQILYSSYCVSNQSYGNIITACMSVIGHQRLRYITLGYVFKPYAEKQ